MQGTSRSQGTRRSRHTWHRCCADIQLGNARSRVWGGAVRVRMAGGSVSWPHMLLSCMSILPHMPLSRMSIMAPPAQVWAYHVDRLDTTCYDTGSTSQHAGRGPAPFEAVPVAAPPGAPEAPLFVPGVHLFGLSSFGLARFSFLPMLSSFPGKSPALAKVPWLLLSVGSFLPRLPSFPGRNLALATPRCPLLSASLAVWIAIHLLACKHMRLP